MTFEEFLEKTVDIIIRTLEISKKEIRPDTKLDINETTRIEIIEKLEDEFKIDVPDDEFEKFATAKSCIECIYKHLVSRIKKFRLTNSKKIITEYFGKET